MKARLVSAASTNQDDRITGFDASDTLAGGAGNDLLSGGDSSDTYIFSRGDGQDRINDNGYYDTDTLRISGYLPSEVILERDAYPNDALTIRFVGTNDVVTIFNTLDLDSTGQIEQVRFDDGTIWTIDQIKASLVSNAATGGGDRITGFDIGDTLCWRRLAMICCPAAMGATHMCLPAATGRIRSKIMDISTATLSDIRLSSLRTDFPTR